MDLATHRFPMALDPLSELDRITRSAAVRVAAASPLTTAASVGSGVADANPSPASTAGSTPPRT